MNGLIFLFSLLVLESFFCNMMKRHDKTRVDKVSIPNRELSAESSNAKSRNVVNVKQLILKILNDFTYLLFKLCGYIPLHCIRKFLYRYVFHMTIGRKAVIYYGLEARAPWNISIGEGSIIGDHAILDARYGIEIGKNVNLSTGVWIWTEQHGVNDPLFGTTGNHGKVYVEDRAWISSRTTVLPGLRILEGSVLAAGAVLTKNFDTPFSILGGVPAKVIGKRCEDLKYEFDGAHRYFL